MEKLDFNRFLKILTNSKLYIIFLLLFFIVVGYFYSFYYVTPMYSSSATIMLVQNDSSDVTNDNGAITQADITLNQNLLSTYTKIAKSDKVLSQVIGNLNLNMSINDLSKNISVQSISNTEVFKISVNNSDPFYAASITNELVKVFSNEVQVLYNMNNVYVMEKAEVSSVPFNVNHVKDIVMFGTVGIIFSLSLVVVVYLFDTTIKSEQDIEEYTGLSVLSTIPIFQNKNGTTFNELIVNEQPKSPISECFKTFRTNVMFSIQNKSLNTILVTSGFTGEGKSFVSSNLAVTFAQSGKKVILVDSDMRKGRINKIFNLSNNIGLSNCLSDITRNGISVNINEYIQKSSIPNLHVMTSGTVPPNPSELLSSKSMRKFLEALNTQYDVVICDGTPCMLVSDSIILSKIVDTTVVVTSNRVTKIDTLLKMKKSIENVGGNIGGAIINKMNINSKSYQNKYYYGNHNETNFEMDLYNTSTDTILDTPLYVSDYDFDDDFENFDIVNQEDDDNSKFNELSRILTDTTKEISELKKLYKYTIQNTLDALAESTDTIEIAENLNLLKTTYQNSILEQNSRIDDINNIVSGISDSNVLSELNSIKELYENNIKEQNDELAILNDKVSNISDLNVLNELDNIKELYENNIKEQNDELAILNDKISNISDLNVLNELDNIKELYKDNVNNQNNEFNALNNKIDSINFNDYSDPILDELKDTKTLYENSITAQNDKIQNLDDKISNISDSNVLNELDNIKELYKNNIKKQNEELNALNEKIENIDFTEYSDPIFKELQDTKNFYENSINAQNEAIASLEDKIANHFDNNSSVIIEELNKMTSSYKEIIETQNNKIEDLNDKISNISDEDILLELDNIKELYENNIKEQSEELDALNEKIENIDFTEYSDSILNELQNTKSYYDDTIKGQNEAISSLENKISDLDVKDNIDGILNELDNIKSSYQEIIKAQNDKIDDLNNIISNFKVTYDTNLLQQFGNIFDQLENINYKFDYLERKATHNEELIKNLGKSNINTAGHANTKILNFKRLDEKVVSIKDYLENEYDSNIDIPKETSVEKHSSNKNKNILDGQLNIIDNLLNNNKEIETASHVATVAIPNANDNDNKFVVNYEKVKNKQKRGLFSFKSKHVEPSVAIDEEVNIVSQILA